MEITAVTSKDARDEFMQLLVTQLRHQDPLDPTKQEDFLSQLAQFSSLEQMEKMNSQLELQVEAQQQANQAQYVSQAATLVGRAVNYDVTTASGATEAREGLVESVAFDAGQVKFKIGTDSVKWDQIRVIKTAPATAAEVPQNNGASSADPGTRAPESSIDMPLRRTRSSMFAE